MGRDKIEMRFAFHFLKLLRMVDKLDRIVTED